MDTSAALDCFAALSQKTRLAVVRLLVSAGPDGLAASAIAERLGVPANTLSTHLKVLSHAGLVSFVRESRVLRYRAEVERLTALTGFILRDCCGGRPELCAALIDGFAADAVVGAGCDGCS